MCDGCETRDIPDFVDAAVTADNGDSGAQASAKTALAAGILTAGAWMLA